MSLTINVNYADKADKGRDYAAVQTRNEKKSGQGQSVPAQNLRWNPAGNPVEEKKRNARRQAMHLISDAWKKDEKSAKNIQNMKDEKQAKINELNDLNSRTQNIEDQKQKYKEAYGISDDSREQKDLELLEKYQNNKNGYSYDAFSKEEISRLKELQNKPLTEYQKRVLELNAAKGAFDVEIERKNAELVGMTGDIHKAEREALKSQDMLDAADAADSIMDAASKDIVGMVVKEAKEHIDETVEEQREKAEEIKEEKEKLEEKTEKAKEEKEEKEEQEKILEGNRDVDKLVQGMKLENQNVDHVAQAQKSIQKIMTENHMINEDIKGIEIDLNF